MASIDRIHPSIALAASILLYPLLFHLTSPSRSSSTTHFIRTREALSISHSIFMVSATLLELYRQSEHWFPPSWRNGQPGQGPSPPSRSVDLIDASPPFTHALIAFECGYLLQDFVVLIHGARRVTTADGYARSVMARNINWRILGWHHLGLAAGLGLFHVRALRGTDKGRLVVLMMMLMNASTPIGTFHWFLTKFRPTQRKSIRALHALYLATYALARVYLFYGILRIFGAWRGQSSALAVFRGLRWQCRFGTGGIVAANTFWLLRGVYKHMRMYCLPARGGGGPKLG